MMMMTTAMMNTFQGEVAERLTVAQEDNTKEEIIETSLLAGDLRETTGEIKMSGSKLRNEIHYLRST